jgi:O-antigen ligase
LLLLLSLLWIPETRVLLQLFMGTEVGHTSVMKPLLACFELLFVAAVLLESRALTVPRSVSRLGVPLSLWLSWMLLASLFSNHTAVALLRTGEWLTHALFALALVSYLNRHESNFKEVTDALLIGFLVYTLLYGIFYFFYQSMPLGFDHIRHYGHYTLIALLLSLSIRKPELASPASIFRIGVLLVAWTALFWTGGRGPLFALAVVVSLLLFFRYFSGRSHLLILLAVSAVTGFLLSIPLSGEEQGIYRILHTVTDSPDIDTFSSSRISIWLAILPNILSSPFFGLGPEGFVYGAGEYFFPILHPHNAVLQFLVEWGLPGTIFFLWLLYRIFVPAFIEVRAGRGNRYLFPALLAGSVALFYSLFTGNLYIPFSVFLFVVVASILIAGTGGDAEPVVINKQRVVPLLLLAALTTVLHGFVMGRFISQEAETPGEFDARLFTLAPVFVTHPESQERVIAWAQQHHYNGEAKKAMQILGWGEETLSRKWMFAYARAAMLLERGMIDAAQQTLSTATNIPPEYQYQVDCLEQRIDDSGRAGSDTRLSPDN